MQCKMECEAAVIDATVVMVEELAPSVGSQIQWLDLKEHPLHRWMATATTLQ